MSKIAITRALISVYDKTGLEELARGLHEAGVEIVSTGSTAARIRDLGVPVTPVDEVTGFPEIMGGRVKTLHPNVHAGLLADQNDPEHMATIDKLGIAPFQLLIANLYPFAETVASGATAPEVIEQIDIGGPAMVRASAKNHGSMTVIVSPAHYGEVLDAVRSGGFELADRQRFAREAFRHTASYDIAVASWLGSAVAPDGEVEFPGWIAASYERAAVLRYGENPHQQAALYVQPGVAGGIANAEQLAG
jgi:phosphoribosylaminoimidazolecarboxamide formyltransferase/IMP cyclohydrolase